jgi:hypothetical protein
MGKDHPDANLHPHATGPAAGIVKVRKCKLNDIAILMLPGT